MSLIEEALRRVQDTMPEPSSGPLTPAPARPPTASVALPQPRPRRASEAPTIHAVGPNLPLPVMASLVFSGLLALGWLAGAWWASRNHAEARTGAPGQPAVLPSPRRHGPAAPPSAMPAFLLSGIVEQAGHQAALVNNTLVQAGDVIDGARVMDVRGDSVWLRWRDQDITLRSIR